MRQKKSDIVKIIETLDKRTAFVKKAMFVKRKGEKSPWVMFSRLACFSTIYAYYIKGGWYLTKDVPWTKAVPDFEITKGRIKAAETSCADKFKEGSQFSLYNISDDTFFIAPSTYVEKKCVFGVKPQSTGCITRGRDLYLGPIDFYLLSNMTVQHYEKIKDRITAPKFVMEVCVSESERYIRLYVADKNAKDIDESLSVALKKHRKKTKGFKNVFMRYYTKPLKGSTFGIPKFFLDAIDNPSEIILPNTFDWENKILTIEAPQERCSCCGKVLPQKGSVVKRGTACYECTVTAQQIQRFALDKTGTSSERVAQALNDIMAESEKYSNVLSAIRNQINKLN